MMDGKPAEIYVEEREEKRENETDALRLARHKPAKTLFLVSHSLQVHSPPRIPLLHPREIINNHTLGGDLAPCSR
jgi:hypothetical protein